MLPSEASSVQQPAQWFATTQWTAVLTAGDHSSPNAQQALQQLCTAYWYPLYAYVRRQGHSVEDAQDLTQEFFARFLEHNCLGKADPDRGRFRTFLLSSLKNFLNNGWKKANCAKRGGGQKLISLDEEMAESRLSAEPAVAQTPDSFYDRGWAAIILERALAALRAEQGQLAKLDQFEGFKVFIWGEKNALSYGEIAKQTGMTEGAAKVEVHRLRRRFGELVRTEIAQTVETAEEAREELRYLLSVIRQGSANFGNF